MKIMAEGMALTSALQGFLAKWHPECMAARRLEEARPMGSGPARVLCLGKAAPGLARAAARCWPGLPGLVYGTAEEGELPPGYRWLGGDHPLPTPRNLEATAEVERWVAREEGPLLACISGGGSALLVHPRAPWTLDMKAAVTGDLWRRGARIRDLNTLRTRLSEVKGGGLRTLAGRWPVITALWSDVGPRDARWVSSGPTLPSDLGRRAREVALRYGLVLPLPLPPCRPSSPRHEGDKTLVLCDGLVLRRACSAWLGGLGMRVREVSCPEGTPARALALKMAGMAATVRARACAFAGNGEGRVAVPRSSGRGGRCSHLVAEVALKLIGKRIPGRWAFAALATDGVDGTAGGGAWTDSESVPPESALLQSIEAFDTASLWATAGTLLPMRPTGNNLRDLWVLVVAP